MNQRFILAVSEALMTELASVIPRKKTQRFLPEARGRWLIAMLQARAAFVTPAADFPHCRDPKGDMIIATAVSARADT
jgi:putative PIN family toxin of toxin-antitoxin system